MERFGDDADFVRVRDSLNKSFIKVINIKYPFESQCFFLLAALRRTNSLLLSFRQSIESKNGQMAMTLIRLNLDTLARLYALEWADRTPNLSSEEFAGRVCKGENIRTFKLLGGKEKATDKWLIDQIVSLEPWIKTVYERTSGAIHFSKFHIDQALGQAEKRKQPDGSLLLSRVTNSPEDSVSDPEHYREVRQAFLHITMMIDVYVDDRCDFLGTLL